MTKTEIRTEVLVRLGKDTTSAWTSSTILNSWIDQAHRWATGYHKWPFTEGRVSTTFASLVANEDGNLVGLYPEGWKSDSIRQLQIGGYRLKKLNWEDFQIFREDYSTGTDRVFSDFNRQYFVNPNIDVSGTTSVWGQYTPTVLDDESTTENTVFSGEEEGNQGIIEEVVGYALRRDGKEKESVEKHLIAKANLDELWKRITDEQYAYQSKNRGMFERINVVDGSMYDDNLNEDQF
jgi:hypothetical protein